MRLFTWTAWKVSTLQCLVYQKLALRTGWGSILLSLYSFELARKKDKKDLQSSNFALLVHSVFWNFELFWLFSFLAEVGNSSWTNGFSKDCFRPRHNHHEQQSSTFNWKDFQRGRVKLLKLTVFVSRNCCFDLAFKKAEGGATALWICLVCTKCACMHDFLFLLFLFYLLLSGSRGNNLWTLEVGSAPRHLSLRFSLYVLYLHSLVRHDSAELAYDKKGQPLYSCMNQSIQKPEYISPCFAQVPWFHAAQST